MVEFILESRPGNSTYILFFTLVSKRQRSWTTKFRFLESIFDFFMSLKSWFSICPSSISWKSIWKLSSMEKLGCFMPEEGLMICTSMSRAFCFVNSVSIARAVICFCNANWSFSSCSLSLSSCSGSCNILWASCLKSGFMYKGYELDLPKLFLVLES